MAEVELYLPRVTTYPERILPSYTYMLPGYLTEYAPVPAKAEIRVPATVRKRLREYAYAIQDIKRRYRKTLKKHAELLRKAKEEEYGRVLPVPPQVPKKPKKKLIDRIKDSWRKESRYFGTLYAKARENIKRIYTLGKAYTRKVGAGIERVVGKVKEKLGASWKWAVDKAKKSKEYLKQMAEKLRAEGKYKEADALEASAEQVTEPAEMALQEAGSEVEEAEKEKEKAESSKWILPMAVVGGGILLVAIFLLMRKKEAV
jgi:hypothetical protein